MTAPGLWLSNAGRDGGIVILRRETQDNVREQVYERSSNAIRRDT